MAKDAWGVIGSAYVYASLALVTRLIQCFRIGVQHVMAEMERIQARGEVPEEELKALEMDMTGKVCRSATLVQR